MLDWETLLADERRADYFQKAVEYVNQERAAGKTIYPPAKDVFNAFRLTPADKVRVVLLGQDPYHGPGQAHGLCFSVKPGVPHPPSLKNIFRELYDDTGCPIPKNGNLDKWARQGVLLLNTSLTVEEGKAGSHASIGWETFTNRVIEQLAAARKGLVFLLWGSHAQKKQQLINAQQHHILTAPHPSPLSAHRGFLGCRHFSLTNQHLQLKGEAPVDWDLTTPLEE